MNIFYLLFVCIVVSFGCTRADRSAQDTDVNLPCSPSLTDTAFYAISRDTAGDWIHRYQKANPSATKFFTVYATDLWEALGIPRQKRCSVYPNLRATMAMAPDKSIHLLFSPATIQGIEIVLRGKYTGRPRGAVLEASDVSEGEYMLDFSNPCPTTCP